MSPEHGHHQASHACFPPKGRDCQFPISRSVRHFIPALVLPEGRFWAQQLLARLRLSRPSPHPVAESRVEDGRPAAPPQGARTVHF